VVGSEGFALGFRLVGVDDVFEIGAEEAAKTLTDIYNERKFGVVIVEEGLFNALSRLDRYQLSNSIRPVFVSVGPSSGSDLQEKVKRAVGIDLYKGGEN
jgi:vacuolar-type H+-ATPase subunit F/Vma7